MYYSFHFILFLTFYCSYCIIQNRCKFKEVFKYYTPSHITFVKNSSVSFIPPSISQLHFNLHNNINNLWNIQQFDSNYTSDEDGNNILENLISNHPLLSHLVTENLVPSSLPSSITHLTASFLINHTILSSFSNFPPNLIYLKCLIPRDISIAHWNLPHSLSHLNFVSPCFGATQVPSFPPHLTHLIFNAGHDSCSPTISSFPSSLLYLEINSSYGDTDLPPLPPSLESLHLYIGVNSSVLPILPSSLKSLVLPGETHLSVPFPSSLISFYSIDRQSGFPPLPSSLLHLSYYNPNIISSNLKHLSTEVIEHITHLPETLTSLNIGVIYGRGTIPPLPSSLLFFDLFLTIPPPTSFPSNLTYLSLHLYLILSRPLPLPLSLRNLSVQENNITSSIQFLLPLPSSLRSFTWTSSYSPTISLPPFPSSLRYLQLPPGFSGTLLGTENFEKEKVEIREDRRAIPSGLMYLKCGRTFYEQNNLLAQLPPQCICFILS